MKAFRVAILGGVAAAVAFFAGRWSVDSGGEEKAAKGHGFLSAPPVASGKENVRHPVTDGKTERPPNAREGVTAEQARTLTREQRMALMRTGALIYDGTRQTAFLEGVIASLSKEEMMEATAALGTAQNRGNFPAPAVWGALWTQWGRVDAAGCLAHFAEVPQGKGRGDARHVMEGWYETNPAEALAWAKEPRSGILEVMAAAYALTRGAEGNIKNLETTLLALPPENPVVKEGLQDYFDLASSATGNADSGSLYEQMPDALKPAAWSTAMQRLNYTDPQAAVNWLTKHASDPGRDYSRVSSLVAEVARENPAATAQWAAGLPEDPASATGPVRHPAIVAYSVWRSKDPVAAEAWLRTQPDTTWSTKLRQTPPAQ